MLNAFLWDCECSFSELDRGLVATDACALFFGLFFYPMSTFVGDEEPVQQLTMVVSERDQLRRLGWFQ